MSFILAIDQGTSSSRALLFDQSLTLIDSAQRDFTQHYPASGWVEHEPDDLLLTTLDVCKTVLARNAATAADVAAIGITNQRETTILWDRKTGTPIYRAIVWQDRRGAALELTRRSRAVTVPPAARASDAPRCWHPSRQCRGRATRGRPEAPH